MAQDCYLEALTKLRIIVMPKTYIIAGFYHALNDAFSPTFYKELFSDQPLIV